MRKHFALVALLASTMCFPLSAHFVDEPAIVETPDPQATTPLVVQPQGDPLFAPVVTSAVPETLNQRFVNWAVLTSGPRSLIAPLFPAAIRFANPPAGYPRAWRLGAGAFGRDYGALLATQASMETGRFLTSAALHEDYRYRPSSSRNVLARTFHAVAFTVFDKTDSGHTTLAVANFVGAGASGFVGELFLPPGFNNLSHAETRTAIAFADFAVRNVLREFAPEIGKVARALHLPSYSRIPEWWVPLNRP